MLISPSIRQLLFAKDAVDFSDVGLYGGFTDPTPYSITLDDYEQSFFPYVTSSICSSCFVKFILAQMSEL